MSDVTAKLRTNTELYQREFETITHNLANANTAGFKRRVSSFTTALQTQMSGSPGAGSVPAGQLELRQHLDFSQGKLVQTGRSLDLALSGEGFFTVETPQGPLYTRNGVFHVDTNGQLVDTNGYAVSGEGGPITLPPTADVEQLEIGPDGRISTGTQALGRLRLAAFPNGQNQLTASGPAGFHAPPGLTPQAPENVSVRQGFQEASNVDTVKEMVGMLSVSRLYEANMNFISARREASRSMMQVAMG